MASNLTIPLTDEMRIFLRRHSGEGTRYTTAADFAQEILRDRMVQEEAEKISQSILQGYRDAIAGRVYEFTGDLKGMLDKVKQ